MFGTILTKISGRKELALQNSRVFFLHISFFLITNKKPPSKFSAMYGASLFQYFGIKTNFNLSRKAI
jgi:hypothetical protein